MKLVGHREMQDTVNRNEMSFDLMVKSGSQLDAYPEASPYKDWTWCIGDRIKRESNWTVSTGAVTK